MNVHLHLKLIFVSPLCALALEISFCSCTFFLSEVNYVFWPASFGYAPLSTFIVYSILILFCAFQLSDLYALPFVWPLYIHTWVFSMFSLLNFPGLTFVLLPGYALCILICSASQVVRACLFFVPINIKTNKSINRGNII